MLKLQPPLGETLYLSCWHTVWTWYIIYIYCIQVSETFKHSFPLDQHFVFSALRRRRGPDSSPGDEGRTIELCTKWRTSSRSLQSNCSTCRGAMDPKLGWKGGVKDNNTWNWDELCFFFYVFFCFLKIWDTLGKWWARSICMWQKRGMEKIQQSKWLSDGVQVAQWWSLFRFTQWHSKLH